MPERRVEFHPLATSEAETAADWYAQRNPQAARAFLKELTHSIEMIREAPERWPRFGKARRYLMSSFPFSIVYRSKGTAIEIVAIAHHKRRPGYWRSR
ncbi:MAG TPA: type II toxin-antitoxin system RelE/ParE family toxin [Thiotrichales bacterium]|nr:type II toxin-antitoxin system RelE/ParE family toxin [Thiotrichales bacterium]